MCLGAEKERLMVEAVEKQVTSAKSKQSEAILRIKDLHMHFPLCLLWLLLVILKY